MKPGRWACCSTPVGALRSLALALVLLGVAAFAAGTPAASDATPDADGVIELRRAQLIVQDTMTPPPDDAAWQPVELPGWRGATTWYRLEFDVARATEATRGSWGVYLPYFYGGGRLLVNGEPIALIPEIGSGHRVRWERPQLVVIPDALLRPGRNVLQVRAAIAHLPSGARLPRVTVGPLAELQPMHDRRLFWVRTMPQVTVACCAVVGLFVLAIWLRRRDEVLYGLFGVAALLWGVRTLTFVVEVLPEAWWPYWRVLYHGATGGFIIVMTLFSLRMGGWVRPWLERGLVGYALLGPVAYLLSGGNEQLIGRWWIAGTIPIGLGMVAVGVAAAWRRRDAATVALMLAIGIATASGIHDYMLAWGSPWLRAVAPEWSGHRFFLLHYGADLLLLVMGAVLTARFIHTLGALEDLNRTLESRVAQREHELERNYARVAALQRENAAAEERQRIMRDLHDGLGSQLFTSLSRVERGELDRPAVAQSLRECIADMRLALEAMAPDGHDFLVAWGNFRFRWQNELDAAGITSQWQVDAPGEHVALPPHCGLQLLRIAQEALTNTLKHAQAQHVLVRLAAMDDTLVMEVVDDGRGLPDELPSGGRGLANMRSRAQRLGATLSMQSSRHGTQLRLELPLASPAASTVPAPAAAAAAPATTGTATPGATPHDAPATANA